MPDLKDYVLKSSIPPKQECPACICPKVNITAEMCNKNETELVCPPCKPCGVEECKGVVSCPSLDAISKKADSESVKAHVKNLILEKDYREIYELKKLLESFKTPEDNVFSLEKVNKELREQIRELENKLERSKMGEQMNNAGVVSSNNRKNNNSPVVDYAKKCENNRVNDWYNVAGVIGSPFNGMNQN